MVRKRRAGFEHLQDAFPAGESSPTGVYIQLGGGASVYDRLPQIEALTTRIVDYANVSSVQSPSNPLGVGGPLDADAIAGAYGVLPADTRMAIDGGQATPPGGDPYDPLAQAAMSPRNTTRRWRTTAIRC